jgi:hypothetical protein
MTEGSLSSQLRLLAWLSNRSAAMLAEEPISVRSHRAGGQGRGNLVRGERDAYHVFAGRTLCRWKFYRLNPALAARTIANKMRTLLPD